jgi:metal-dependent hydrolase (beta-lactamase superfamily II)
LFAVLGGFHLFEDDQIAAEGTIAYFKKENPQYIYPMHCVDFPVLSKFHAIFGVRKLGAGDILEF